MKILKTKMDKNLLCIMQTRRIKERSLLSLKNFMPKLWTLNDESKQWNIPNKIIYNSDWENNYRSLCFWFDKIKTSKEIFKKVCKVNSKYEIKTKRHQNVIYLKWVLRAWNSKGIFAWTAHISKDNSRALHKNFKGFKISNQ